MNESSTRRTGAVTWRASTAGCALAGLAVVAIVVTVTTFGGSQRSVSGLREVSAAPPHLTSKLPATVDQPISSVRRTLVSILERGATGVTKPTDPHLVAEGAYEPLSSLSAGSAATLDFTAAGAPHELFRLWASNESGTVTQGTDPCAQKLASGVYLSCKTLAGGDKEFVVTTAATNSKQLPTAAGGPADGMVRYVRSVTLLNAATGVVAFHDNIDVEPSTGLSDAIFSVSEKDAVAIVAETDRLYGQLMGR